MYVFSISTSFAQLSAGRLEGPGDAEAHLNVRREARIFLW